VICKETEELILHRRSPKISRDLGGYLHTFGGAYKPSEVNSIDDDGKSLMLTATRELREESKIVVGLESVSNMILGEEALGFVHLALLGVLVSPADVARAKANLGGANLEGDVTEVSFQHLKDKLMSDHWVPAGKVQVLAWLALGARIGPSYARFNSLSGPELFDEIIS
jgi:hypothetical protein